MQRLLVAAARRTGHPHTRQNEDDLRGMVEQSAEGRNGRKGAARAGEPCLILGARVVLRGLVASKQLNGSVATVLSANAQRYTVQLDSGVALKLKREGICVLCTGCARQSDEARACGRCVAAWYCSVECQRAHWRTHKPACNAG